MTTFQRAMKKYHVAALAIGGTISSVYFLGNGYLLKQVGPFAFLAFIFGGLISYLTMSCLAELAANEELTHHSFLSFAKKYISPTFSCGVGWAYWVDWVIIISAECLAGGILMHSFVPQISPYRWAMLFGLFVTYINLRHVRIFSITAFWLTLIYLVLFFGFTILAIWIFFDSEPFIGVQYLLSEGAFPNGISIFFLTMVVLLLNFQGTELVGLSASEAHEPSEKLPRTMKEISLIISGLYIVPIFLLALIYPWNQASLEGSVFATALKSYGFKGIAHFFTFLIVAGSLSCANSGLYAAVRALHALSTMHMAPRFLTELSKRGTPQRATFATFLALWIVLFFIDYFPSDQIYVLFLAFSGFAGSMLWISICWSQLRSRKHRVEPIRHKMLGYPYLTHFVIWAQVFGAIVMLWNDRLRPSFLFGIFIFLVPMLCYRIARKDDGSHPD